MKFNFLMIISLFNISLFMEKVTYYKYFPKYVKKNGDDLTMVLKHLGLDCLGVFRIAELNSIENYSWFDNEKDQLMFDLLKEGKLIKEKISIPIMKDLILLFKKSPLLYDCAEEIAYMTHILFQSSPFPYCFNFAIIGAIVTAKEYVGMLNQNKGKSGEEKHLDDLYDFTNKYEGNSLSDFSLSEIETMIEHMNKKNLLSYFKLGIKSWSEYNDLLTLFKLYKKENGGKDAISSNEIYIAESTNIVNELNTKYIEIFNFWKDIYYCQTSSSIQDEIGAAERLIINEYLKINSRNSFPFAELIYEILNEDEKEETVKIDVGELIPILTKDLFDTNINYEKGKECSFEKEIFNIKIKNTFDKYENKFKSDMTFIIYNGKEYIYRKRFDKEINNCFNYIYENGEEFEKRLKNLVRGVYYINYDPNTSIIELIVIPLIGNHLIFNSEYSEGFVYEIIPKRLSDEEIEIYKNLNELRLSSVYINLKPNEDSLRLKMKVPFDDNFCFEFSNNYLIYFYSTNGNIMYIKQSYTCLSFKKDLVIYIHIKIINNLYEHIIFDIEYRNYKNYLPYQPIEDNSDYELSNDKGNPLKAFEIKYKKRKGEALYIYCNNPEKIDKNNLNKALIRNTFTDKEVFFTMEHNSEYEGKAYMGYRLKNIGNNDLFVTIRNIGYYIAKLSDDDWSGQKEWVQFYNVNFRFRNQDKLKADDLARFKKQIYSDYWTSYWKPETYRIPPGNYIYVLGGTSADAYDKINVFKTANIEFKKGIINGVVLFEVKGTAEAALYFYDGNYKHIDENDHSSEFLLNGKYKDGNNIGAQYKGYDNCHGVVDGYAFWEFNDNTQSQFLPVKITNYYRDGKNLINQEAYSEIDNIKKHEYTTDYWVTNSNPQKFEDFREAKIGSDLMEFNIYNEEFKDIKIDNSHYDGRGNVSNTANWMTNYITSYYLVNSGSKEREVTVTIKGYGVIACLVVDSNGYIINESEQFALYDKNSENEIFHECSYNAKIEPKGKVKFYVEHTLLANSCGRVIHRAKIN